MFDWLLIVCLFVCLFFVLFFVCVFVAKVTLKNEHFAKIRLFCKNVMGKHCDFFQNFYISGQKQLILQDFGKISQNGKFGSVAP